MGFGGREQALLAYAMNGEPLPIQHGYPLRLIVPGWYAVASVKWLTEIEIIGEPFRGQYQTDSYFYESERDGHVVRDPVTLQRVRSLITRIDEPGTMRPRARATDLAGRSQPDEQVWNRLGYGNNVIHDVSVHVR